MDFPMTFPASGDDGSGSESSGKQAFEGQSAWCKHCGKHVLFRKVTYALRSKARVNPSAPLYRWVLEESPISTGLPDGFDGAPVARIEYVTCDVNGVHEVDGYRSAVVNAIAGAAWEGVRHIRSSGAGRSIGAHIPASMPAEKMTLYALGPEDELEHEE